MPTTNLSVFSGTRSSGPRTTKPADHDDHGCCRGRRDRQSEPPLGRAEGDDDEGDLEALEEHALEGDGERVPIHLPRAGERDGAGLPALTRERLRFVVQRLVAGGAEDRLAQPLQAESEQQGPHDEPQRPDRDVLQRRAERGDDHGEHHRRCADADHRRAPAADDPDREDDGQCLDRLDRGGNERGQEDEDGVAHGSAGFR